MQELRDRVAVVTGGGSGIGRALALAFADEGMRVVVSDVEESSARAVADEVKSRGAEGLAVRTDVADETSVQRLAEATYERFGATHLLCNNAGVLQFGLLKDATSADWRWMLGVNLWGVIHGVQAFLPRMLRQEGERHIVNTASFAGVAAGIEAGVGTYSASKYAVVALSEQLRTELAPEGIGVSCLCPGMVATRITEAGRNRPDALGGPAATDERWLDRDRLQHAMPPEEVARMVLRAVRADEDYVFTHAEYRPAVEMRFQAILAALERVGS